MPCLTHMLPWGILKPMIIIVHGFQCAERASTYTEDAQDAQVSPLRTCGMRKCRTPFHLLVESLGITNHLSGAHGTIMTWFSLSPLSDVLNCRICADNLLKNKYYSYYRGKQLTKSSDMMMARPDHKSCISKKGQLCSQLT